MFHRNIKGKLVFEKLNFEIVISDMIESAKPKDMGELKWMVKNMVNSIQTCAFEYASESEEIGEEWEDIFFE